MTPPAPLAALIPETVNADTLLAGFLDFAASRNLTLYPAQEEAILGLLDNQHVVLNTPTGSGKSLVALALHFKCVAEKKVSVYTSPIKALVNEKFFALCELFGPDRVGMLTGDASINRDAPILCCTAEILSNVALREGAKANVDAVIMDEFHYYADRDRGVAWQIPLLILERAQFLLMSATLGDMTGIVKQIEGITHRTASIVANVSRPVPLEFEYRLTPLHETIAELVAAQKAPIYLVNFTQRESAEQAQNLVSVNLCSREEKERIRETLFGFKFDSPYGKELQRFLRAGIGVHHAGLLPKYRRLVERMAQDNMLRVISGTDTLGVGVNIPLRTVLFTQLCKFDGQKTIILSARDFHQIGGRAGRKGFDDRGYVVAQAPEHVIENIALQAKAAAGKKVVKKKPPEKGYVHFDQQTFEKLQTRLPKPLESRFEVTHGMLLNLLQRPEEQGSTHGGGYRQLLQLIQRSHESDWHKRRHKKHAAVLFRSLRRAEIIRVERQGHAGATAVVSPDLQRDFSLHQTLSLYLVETLAKLDPESDGHALDVLTLVESILENPKVVLMRQVDKAKGEKIAELKAQGMEYLERMQELEKVEHPKPNAGFLYATFDEFEARHPWIGKENVRPKSIVRDMYERGDSFNDYVREYGLERSEGVLLRYIMDAYKTLTQSVPERYRTEEVLDALAFLRLTLAAVDTSLLDEWEELRHPEIIVARVRHEPIPVLKVDPAADPKALTARVRGEVHRLLQALAKKEWDEALTALNDPDHVWTAAKLEAEVATLIQEHGGIDTTPRARGGRNTTMTETGRRVWDVHHRILAKDGDEFWVLEGEIDLTEEHDPDLPMLRLRRIGT